MTHYRSVLLLVFTAVALASCASGPPAVPEARPNGTGRIDVTMTGFADEKGQALVALFLDDNGWPDAGETTFATAAVPIRDGQAVVSFENVPAGAFAVSVFHDENGDRELDSGALGIPTEDYGFSADARSTFGPPSFTEARLELMAGESKQITIKVK